MKHGDGLRKQPSFFISGGNLYGDTQKIRITIADGKKIEHIHFIGIADDVVMMMQNIIGKSSLSIGQGRIGSLMV